jgi:hypothetical protein
MEDETNALKSLKFTTLPSQGGNPILDRLAKSYCSARRAKADPERPKLHPHKSEVGKEGRRKGDGRTAAARAVVVATTSERLICLFVRSGLKPIEFKKGKPAIAVSSLDKLPSVIDTLITAVRNGELDQQFSEASADEVIEVKRKARDVMGVMGSGIRATPP